MRLCRGRRRRSVVSSLMSPIWPSRQDDEADADDALLQQRGLDLFGDERVPVALDVVVQAAHVGGGVPDAWVSERICAPACSGPPVPGRRRLRRRCVRQALRAWRPAWRRGRTASSARSWGWGAAGRVDRGRRAWARRAAAWGCGTGGAVLCASSCGGGGGACWAWAAAAWAGPRGPASAAAAWSSGSATGAWARAWGGGRVQIGELLLSCCFIRAMGSRSTAGGRGRAGRRRGTTRWPARR